ncbi:helix-turn-helix transcriptional regulator [Haladaptatus caseinilyticus]|uniref:helix-turn-helix transcriptional regulator n=1 Tax=Haladaptatus caseinilyticus TaxID=2993314 RepID=UPI00224B3DE3|nr:helix-turn-helix transcriptional regulator [Haladaptatus caseinilyticus]
MTNSEPNQDTSAGSHENESALDFVSYNLPTDLTAFQAHLLCLIYRLGPAEGVDLQEALEDLYPEPINHGRLYPGLDRLVEKGLISKQTKASDKRRNVYATVGRGDWAVEEYYQFLHDIVTAE